MATIVFDFDSTLISCESVEVILERKLQGRPELRKKIEKITDAGLRGNISFTESLAKRLAIAAPTRNEALSFGEEALQWITPGMEELIHDLQKEGNEVWIISGGIQESLVSVGKKLGVIEERIQGVRLMWSEQGDFLGINSKDPFSRSKREGVCRLVENWHSLKIGIGDAMSDYELFAGGLLDYFILFTQHFRCEEVLKKGATEAKNMEELRKMVREYVISGKR